MKKTAASLLIVLLAALTTTGCSALGKSLERDYPSADPAVVSHRLEDRAQWAYEGMELPPHEPVEPTRVNPSHTCQRGGLTIDKVALDAVSFELGWTVENIPVDVARTTEQRLRRHFTTAGWTLTHDRNRQSKDWIALGFRFEDPKTGDKFDLAWNDSTTSLFLDGYAPCAKVPQEYADGHRPRENWTPSGNPSRTE